MKKKTREIQRSVIQLLESGKIYREIRERCLVSNCYIHSIKKTFLPDLQVNKGGRPRSLSQKDISAIVRNITSGKVTTASEVAKSFDRPVSRQTVARALRSSGLKAIARVKKPALSVKNSKARLEFALKHKNWTLDDWKRVVWSDETKINRLGSDGKRWCWKINGKDLQNHQVQQTAKFGGGSLMFWGCMTYQGVGYAARIDGRVNGELYRGILQKELIQTIEHYDLNPDFVIFQQDNAPCHKAKDTMKWFEEQEIAVMDWPPQSPDLNPIEHLWVHVKKELGKYPEAPKGIHELWTRIEEVWVKVPIENCQRLIESMPRRVRAVIKAKGCYTKY